jgi:2,3-bisphosphoglycerate-dependent phosphoglycerate mutase
MPRTRHLARRSTCRTPSEVARPTSGGPIVWFVRHAQSIWNEARLVQGQSDAPGLSSLGIGQARELAARLAGTGAGSVLSSDLLRAMETAGPIAARLGVSLDADPQLRERNLGAFEGGSSAELIPAVTGYDGGGVVDPDARPPGGESLRELYARVNGCVEGFRSSPPAPVFVAVTHGGFMRVARACLEGTSVDSMRWPATPNAVVWRVDLATGELSEDPFAN